MKKIRPVSGEMVKKKIVKIFEPLFCGKKCRLGDDGAVCRKRKRNVGWLD